MIRVSVFRSPYHRAARFGGSGAPGRCRARLLYGFVLALLALVDIGVTPAAAHPHAWIDLRTAVVLDDDGRIVAIEQEWLFDEFYTVFATDGLVNGDPDDAAAALTELARANLAELKPYSYFTEVRADGAKVELGTVKVFESSLRQGRLWLSFVLPLVEPVDPRRQEVVYAVFDPTYYIEMLHLEGDPIIVRGPGAEGCFGSIQPPEPPAEAVMFAAALDRTAEAGDGLGALFAERVSMTC